MTTWTVEGEDQDIQNQWYYRAVGCRCSKQSSWFFLEVLFCALMITCHFLEFNVLVIAWHPFGITGWIPDSILNKV
jgi:hypothetical protein